MMRALVTLFLLALMMTGRPLAAEIRTELREYSIGDQTFEAFVAWDDAVTGKRPGILIVHQWKGISDHEREVAKRLAADGYVAFCADIYGKGVRPQTNADAGKAAGEMRGGDRAEFRSRLVNALGELRGGFPEIVDPNRIAAIGYCFGGTAALELARINADVQGVVSFHGSLTKGTGETQTPIIPKILVLHGDADPAAPPADVAALQQELRDAKADWELVLYSDVVHSFTDRNANSDRSRYDAQADARSWKRMHDFFDELFER